MHVQRTARILGAMTVKFGKNVLQSRQCGKEEEDESVYCFNCSEKLGKVVTAYSLLSSGGNLSER